jgi:hypothetical protein
MSSIRPVSVPSVEPVSVIEAQDYLKIPHTQDNTMLAGLISAARSYAESATGRSLASKDYVQTLDMFPYYTETLVNVSQAAISSYYARYSTLWNYSQMLKLGYSPVTEVKKITYIGVDGYPHDIFPGVDFLVDYVAEDCRLFPIPGAYWPVVLYAPNCIAILFTAGYDPDPTKVLTINAADQDVSPPSNTLPDPPKQQASVTLAVGIPYNTKLAVLILACHWYMNREPVSAGTVGSVPNHIDALLASSMVFDYSPTRG